MNLSRTSKSYDIYHYTLDNVYANTSFLRLSICGLKGPLRVDETSVSSAEIVVSAVLLPIHD